MTPKRDSRGARETEENETERLSARLRGEREEGEKCRTPPTPLRVVGGQVHQPRDALDLFLRSSFSMRRWSSWWIDARTELIRLYFFLSSYDLTFGWQIKKLEHGINVSRDNNFKASIWMFLKKLPRKLSMRLQLSFFLSLIRSMCDSKKAPVVFLVRPV